MLPSITELERELGRESLYAFVKLAWPILEPSTPFLDNWHIRLICEKLESVSSGECKRLIINVPPGSAKSSLVCVLWNAWDWIRNPQRKFLYTSFDARLTRRDGARTIELVTSEWFRARWGSVFGVSPDVADADFKNDRGGVRFATSVRGKTTGEHPHILVVDDPSKPKETSDKALAEVINWWKSTIISRGNQLEIARVIIMQRLHEQDLCGWLLEGEGRDEWEVVSIPLEFDPERACVGDPRTEEGEIFWKSRYTPEIVAQLKGPKGLGAKHYAAQYQQLPAPDGGLIFQAAWLTKRWSQLPDPYDDACLSWDMAFKDGDGADWVVGTVWLRKGADYYLVDRVRKKMGFTETVQEFVGQIAKWPRIRRRIVEDKANGTAVVDVLKRKISGLVLVNPDGGKVARANAVTPYFEAGNVWLPNASWVDEYVLELVRFPLGAHDDQVDSTTQALNYLGSKTNDYTEAMKNAKSMFGLLA